MASAWAKSWGLSWGASWGKTADVEIPSSPASASGGGGGGPDVELSLSDYVRKFGPHAPARVSHKIKRRKRSASALFMLHKL